MALTLSNSIFLSGTAFNAVVEGAAANSTLALTANPGGRWSLGGRLLVCSNPQAGDMPAVTETLAGGGSTAYPFSISARNAPSSLRVSGFPAAASVGSSSDFIPAVSGGVAPYSVQVIGRLPAGRSLSGTTIVGTYLSTGPNVYALQIGDATGATVRLTVSENVAPPIQRALLVSSTGNSRSIGRAAATGADIWPSIARQWTQAGVLSVPATTQLDVADPSGNTTPGSLSPCLPFANEVVAQTGSYYSLIVFVPDGAGSSGFSDGTWAATATPNRLSGNVARFNAAHAFLTSQGYQVETAWHFYNANPDSGADTWPSLRDFYQNWYAYIRANATGMATAPIFNGGGQAAAEITADPNYSNNAIHATIGKASSFAESYDIIMDRYGLGGTWPLVNFDGTHLDRAGTLVQGKLMYGALQRAKARTDWQAPYKTLSFFNDFAFIYDFDIAAASKDARGTSASLVQVDAANNPRVRPDAAVQRYLYQRPAGTNRYWQMPTSVVPAASYTKSVMFNQAEKLVTQGLWGDIQSTAANQQRLQFAFAADAFQAGHGSGVNVSFPAADVSVGQWYLITVTYDSPSQTMRLYLNEVLKATATGVAPHSMPNFGWLAANNAAAAAIWSGNMAFAGAVNKALSDAEVSALYALQVARLNGAS